MIVLIVYCISLLITSLAIIFSSVHPVGLLAVAVIAIFLQISIFKFIEYEKDLKLKKLEMKERELKIKEDELKLEKNKSKINNVYEK